MSRTKNPSKIAICQNPTCSKDFIINPGCTGKFCSLNCCNKARDRSVCNNNTLKRKELRKQLYYTNPNYCKQCNSIIKYKDNWKTKQFCNKTCSTVYNNIRRPRKIKTDNSKYRFAFKLESYPDLFDLEIIYSIVFYGRKNIKGLARDHRVSVYEAIKNNYDPFYISHPINCEIMPQWENSRKHTKSSITYDELKDLVDRYEKMAAR